MQKWEYLYILFWREKPRFTPRWSEFKTQIDGKEMALDAFEQYMQTLGEQGWELVTAIPVAARWETSWLGMTTSIRFIFKRPKSQAPNGTTSTPDSSGRGAG